MLTTWPCCGTWEARFEELGYEADARIVDTWLHGVPQHRQRLAIVGVRDGKAFSWPDNGNPVTLTTFTEAHLSTSSNMWNAEPILLKNQSLGCFLGPDVSRLAAWLAHGRVE